MRPRDGVPRRAAANRQNQSGVIAMSLAELIRGKSTSDQSATATVATFATHKPKNALTVASVAGVAVAKPKEAVSEPLSADEEKSLRRWLRSIRETDPRMIAALLDQCHRDMAARTYFLRLAASLPFDDRITCEECANLAGSRCMAAARGEVDAHARYEPVQDVLRRCEGFKPLSDEVDRREGKERWPSLVKKAH